MRVSRRGSQALALGTGVAALLAIAAPASFAKSDAAITFTLTKSSGPATVAVGTPFTYNLGVTAVPATTAPAIVSDTLPAGLAFQSASAGCGLVTPDTVNCVLPAGTTAAALAITVVPVTPTTTPTPNTATVTATGADTGSATATSATATAITGRAMTCFGAAPTAVIPDHTPFWDGTAGNDVIIGSRGNDIIDGGPGDDLICGDGGNDHIYGGSGDDKIAGGRGSDFLDGGAGHNTLRGGRDSFGFNSMSTASADRRWRDHDRDRDTLVCQRRIDDCRGGFDGFGDRGRRHGDHGDHDRIIFVPERDRRDGDFRDFSADKAAPAKSHAKPDAKPVSKPDAKPVAKPLPKPDAPSAPAVAGTEPVAPKA